MNRSLPAALGLLATLLWSTPGHAWDDPTWRLATHHLREDAHPFPTGGLAGDEAWVAAGLARSQGGDSSEARRAALTAVLGPSWTHFQGEPDWRTPEGGLRWGATASAGTRVPQLLAGDEELGMAALRGRVHGQAWLGHLHAVASPELALGLGADGDGASVPLRRAWVGWKGPLLAVGAGLQPRRIGPGRRSALLLSDNAAPVPMGTVAGRRQLGRFGAVSAELGVGWLNGARSDVANPGLLLMDMRWAPMPWFELGATRMGIFGGEGRPAPPLGQLLLPTDPHVYDDPDQLEPDQDELASLDIRGTLPIGRLVPALASDGGPIGLDRIEVWWQYGAEDVIARELGPLPYPGLAGVANLVGGEVAGGDWALQVEGTRLLDDYFRWYTGHRVYHDGFTRDGRAMGAADGGDSLSLEARVLWLPGERGGEVWLGQARRVGVIEATGPNILALQADERRYRGGVGLWMLQGAESGWPAWLQVRAELERVESLDFVEGDDGWTWRVALSR